MGILQCYSYKSMTSIFVAFKVSLFANSGFTDVELQLTLIILQFYLPLKLQCILIE